MEPENRPGPDRLQKHQFPSAKIVRFREGIGQLHPLRPQLFVSLTRNWEIENFSTQKTVVIIYTQPKQCTTNCKENPFKNTIQLALFPKLVVWKTPETIAEIYNQLGLPVSPDHPLVKRAFALAHLVQRAAWCPSKWPGPLVEPTAVNIQRHPDSWIQVIPSRKLICLPLKMVGVH